MPPQPPFLHSPLPRPACKQQVTSRPAAQALAQRSATASPDAARARAQTMAQAVVAQVNQVAAAATVAGKVTATYTHALSGFLVKGPTLTELQALLNDPAVVAVWPNNAVSTVREGGCSRRRRMVQLLLLVSPGPITQTKSCMQCCQHCQHAATGAPSTQHALASSCAAASGCTSALLCIVT